MKIMEKDKISEHKIICGDCIEVMKEIEHEKINLVIADPPYGSGGRDGSVHLNNTNIEGNRMSADSYIWFVRQYAKLLFNITTNDTHCYIFSDWRKFVNVRIAFETVGWECRALIVWDKGNGMGEYWRSSHEFILWFTKRNPRKLTHGGCFNVLHFPSKVNKQHPSEKPMNLISFLISASSRKKDLILDPFMGSGTTMMVSEKLKRNSIGIEISKKYCELAYQRLVEEIGQVKFSGEQSKIERIGF